MLANTASDELGVLGAEVEDEDSIELRLRAAERAHAVAVSCSPAFLTSLGFFLGLTSSGFRVSSDHVVKTGFQAGLRALFGKLGIPLGKAAGGAEAAKAALQAKETKDAKGPQKGRSLADGELIAGMGFSPEDKTTAQKNLAEKANIDRFMQDPTGAAREAREAPGFRDHAPAGDVRDARAEDGPKGASSQELRDDIRREERGDELRHRAGQEAKDPKEREPPEKKEAERRRRDHDEEEGRRGSPFVHEEITPDEDDEHRPALRDEDALGASDRCRGTVADGTRCLRRPVEGTPYCREHSAQRS